MWIAADEWSADTGGRVILYGANDHAKTMLILNPGAWVRVIGKGHFALDEDLVQRTIFGHPVDHVYALASLYRQETLVTPTQSATLSREIGLAKTHEQAAPIQLTIP